MPAPPTHAVDLPDLLDLLKEVVVVFDRDGRVLHANASAARAYGQAAGELLGRTHEDIAGAPPAPGTPFRTALAAVIAGGPEVSLLASSREGAHWYEVTIYPHQLGAFATARDVTEMHRAHADLARSEERFRAMVEFSPEAILIFDTSTGRFSDVNPEAEKLFGRTRTELLALGPGGLMPETQPDGRNSEGEVRDVIGRTLGGERVVGEYEALGRGGERLILELHTSLLPSTSPVLIRASLFDITARKRAQQHLADVQRLEAIARLAGGVAHDFNNLLTIIMSSTQLALRGLPRDHPARSDLDASISAAERAALVTRQLLAFGRKQHVSPRVIDLSAYIEHARPVLQRLVGEDVEVALDLSRSLGGAVIDPAQVEQILLNLAANARDAMPRGGRLTLHTSDVVVDAGGLHNGVPPGRYVQLSVADTGEGIPDAVKPHVFEPFFTTKAQGRGTGLGLATVHGIVKHAGGHIWVDSGPGLGTSFKIYLPVAGPREGDPVPLEEAEGPAVGGPETILVVEDEDSVRTVLRRALQRHGYTVLDASNAGEALLLCERHAGVIHLMLTDVVMPRMTGPELATRLRPLRPEMRVVYMSGYNEERLDAPGHDEHSDGFLAKPASVDALLERVRGALDGPRGAAVER